MTETNKTLLIVGGIALAGYFAYKYLAKGGGIARSNNSNSAGGGTTSGTGSNQNPGNTNWWQNLGSYGSAASGAIGSIDRTYNSIYNFFGGASTDGGGNLGAGN